MTKHYPTHTQILSVYIFTDLSAKRAKLQLYILYIITYTQKRIDHFKRKAICLLPSGLEKYNNNKKYNLTLRQKKSHFLTITMNKTTIHFGERKKIKLNKNDYEHESQEPG
jgi:hypothetical protein